MNEIEQELQAKGLTAPRISPADIEANIALEHYMTPADALGAPGTHIVVGKGVDAVGVEDASIGMNLLTICTLVLRNGFIVTGESACVSPENFDAEIGRKIARQKAVEKMWPLLGFQLKVDLHGRAYSAGNPGPATTEQAPT